MISTVLKTFLWIIVTILAVLIAMVSIPNIFIPADKMLFTEQIETYQQISIVIRTHIALGVTALIIGPLQFIGTMRSRMPIFHRTLGYVYVLSVIVSSATAFLTAPFAYGGVSNAVAFSILAILWAMSTLAALHNAVRKDFGRHRRWMIRSYAVTLAAVSLRVQIGVMTEIFGLSFDEAYLIAPWTCWVINLILVEWWLLPAWEAGSSEHVKTSMPDHRSS